MLRDFGTNMHLEEIICIYYLLKKIILPLAYFPNNYFFSLLL